MFLMCLQNVYFVADDKVTTRDGPDKRKETAQVTTRYVVGRDIYGRIEDTSQNLDSPSLTPYF